MITSHVSRPSGSNPSQSTGFNVESAPVADKLTYLPFHEYPSTAKYIKDYTFDVYEGMRFAFTHLIATIQMQWEKFMTFACYYLNTF